jgi:hypothetical protein
MLVNVAGINIVWLKINCSVEELRSIAEKRLQNDVNTGGGVFEKNTVSHELINYFDTNAKCLHLKNHL